MTDRQNLGDSPALPGSGRGREKGRAGGSPSKSGRDASRKTPSSEGKARAPGSKSGSPKGGRRGQSRRSNKLVGSLGTIFSWYQVSHLDGLSDIHFDDVADARALKRPHETAVDLAELALLMPERVSEIEKLLAEERLTEAFFRGTGDRPELVSNFWFGDAGAGFQSPRDGHPGTAVAMPGDKWVRLLRQADAARHIWRDSGGKVRKSEAMQKALRKGQELDEEGYLPKMSGQLRKIYARIPPWIGVVAGQELSPRELKEIAEQVARAFSKETGYRVLAANIHREASHDLHIHLIFTDVIPAAQEVEHYKPATLKRMLQDLRNGKAKEALVAAGNLKPSKTEKEAELERMFQDGELEDPRKGKPVKGDSGYEYRKQELPTGSREHLRAMGPAYVSKTWLWEASGRSERVAMVNEQANHFLNFRGVVMEAAKRDIAPRNAKGPEDVFIDYWLSRRWTEAVLERISGPGKEEIAREAAASVERYVDGGRSLPEPFSQRDLDLRARKLQDAEDARTEAIRAKKDADQAHAEAMRAKKSAEHARKLAEESQAVADRFLLEVMEPPTLAEVAEKMNFKPEDGKEGLWRLPEGHAFADQILITGRTFVRSQPARGMPSREEGEGAVALLATEDTTKTRKRTKVDLLAQLVRWFPTKAIGLLNEALGQRGGEVLRGFFQLDVVKGKAKKAEKSKEDPP